MEATEAAEAAQNTPAAEPDTPPVPAPEPVPTPDAAPGTAPDAAPDAAAAPEAASDAAPAAAPAPRRRAGRTVALIAVAAVLGVVGGTAVGYGVQAGREPTPLPALNQPGLAYPAKPLPKGKEPAPLSAAEDRGLKTEGDLRKLLLAVPAGSRKADFAPEDGWLSVSSYASDFSGPSGEFEYLLENGVRRVASTAWRTGEYRFTQINLVQFRSDSGQGAADHAEDQRSFMEDEAGYGEPIKGSPDGRTYQLPVEHEAGYELHQARAYVHRGDVMVEIFVTDTKKISQKDISSLAERQLERL
ncbi:hypothetical protein ACIGO8_18335 [Streptomyces sp. NPDC053493]|uniref:hypothetical protein n=1 Tax=Streptomyces sp. NPDC053493 TaxID=3365705 RepID=UPI0037D8B32E